MLWVCAMALLLYGCSSFPGVQGDQPPAPFKRNNILYIAAPEDFDAAVSRRDGLMVVCFTDKYCHSCKTYASTFRKAAAAFAGLKSVYFISFDTFYAPEKAKRFNVKGLPATVLVRNGAAVATFAGPVGHDELQRAVQEAIPQEAGP